jgi:hypothetical protein
LAFGIPEKYNIVTIVGSPILEKRLEMRRRTASGSSLSPFRVSLEHGDGSV